MKFFLLSAVLSPVYVVLGQINNNWGCDHYNLWPTDVCFPSSSFTYKYTCNGTHGIMYEEFTDLNDCESRNDPTNTNYHFLDGTTAEIAECDNGKSCDYFSIICNNSLHLILPLHVCYSGSGSFSIIWDCSGSETTTTSYSTNDCSGSTTCGTFDYADTYTHESCEVKK